MTYSSMRESGKRNSRDSGGNQAVNDDKTETTKFTRPKGRVLIAGRKWDDLHPSCAGGLVDRGKQPWAAGGLTARDALPGWPG